MAATPFKLDPDDPTPPGSPPVGSPVTAFGRPAPVVVVGPRPLPVTSVGPAPGTGGGPGGGAGGGFLPRDEDRKPFRAALLAGLATLVQGARASTALTAAGAAGSVAGGGRAYTAVAGLGAAISAGQSTVSGFAERGREISGFSGPLASAAARADVMRLQTDIREAEQMGPQLAELIEQQAKLEATFSELVLPIKRFLVEALSTSMDVMLKTVLGVLEGVNDLIETVGGKSDALINLIKEIKRIVEGDRLPADPMGDILKMFDDIKPPPAGAVVVPGGGFAPIAGAVLAGDRLAGERR